MNQAKIDCEHTEVTHAEKITCDQCGQVVVEVPVVETGGGIIYSTTKPKQAVQESAE
jgi:hypothetical protein